MSAVLANPKTIWDMVGCHHVPSFGYEIGREKIREFARAVHDDHPAHRDENEAAHLGHPTLIAPVTFVSVIGTAVLSDLFRYLLIGYDVSGVLHTDQKISIHRPLRAGDYLSSDLCLESFRRSNGSDIMVTGNTITDQFGRPVATTSTTFVARTPGTEPGLPDHLTDLIHGIMRRSVD